MPINIATIMLFSQFFATKDIQLTGIPTINLQLKHRRKADIDATRGSFELPTNSKTTYA